MSTNEQTSLSEEVSRSLGKVLVDEDFVFAILQLTPRTINGLLSFLTSKAYNGHRWPNVIGVSLPQPVSNRDVARSNGNAQLVVEEVEN